MWFGDFAYSNGQKNLNLVLLKERYLKVLSGSPTPCSLCNYDDFVTSDETSCGIGEKKAEDVDKFDLIRLQTNQMATVQSLKRTSQSTRVKDNIK